MDWSSKNCWLDNRLYSSKTMIICIAKLEQDNDYKQLQQSKIMTILTAKIEQNNDYINSNIRSNR